MILIFFLSEERSLFRNRSMVSSRNSSLSNGEQRAFCDEAKLRLQKRLQ